MNALLRLGAEADLLTSNGALSGATPLELAQQAGHMHLLLLLRDAEEGSRLTRERRLADFFMAAQLADLDVLEAILDTRKVDVNAVNEKGWGAMTFAAASGNLAMVQLLVRVF